MDRLQLSIYSWFLYGPGGLLHPQLRTLLAVVTSNSLVIGFLYPLYEVALTPWRKAFLGSIVVSQFFKEFAEFYGNRSFITLFKRVQVGPWPERDESTCLLYKACSSKNKISMSAPSCTLWNVLSLGAKRKSNKARFLPSHKDLNQTFLLQWHTLLYIVLALLLTNWPITYGAV